jgi:hypothetical protein
MTREDQDRAAVRKAVLTPIPLLEHRACLGQFGDDQCTACVLRVEPKDYTGQFPALSVIVPDMRVQVLYRPDRTHYTELVCRDRRIDFAAVQGPSLGRYEGGVSLHAQTVQELGQTRKPAVCGGDVVTSSAGAGLSA